MKANYHNEDYTSNIFSLVICIIITIIVVVWGIGNKVFFDIGGIIFLCIIILFVLIPMIWLTKRYCKQKQQRDLNLFIIKNGICIEGRVVSIYDNCISGLDIGSSTLHNVTAEITYNIDNEEKNIVVDDLCINIHRLKNYENKIVKIYIYNNMNYIDVIN